MTKEFKTIDEQIEILRNRKLLFENEEAAKRNLMRYGYYEIINGYKTPLIDKEKSTEKNELYKENSTFEHIFSLYQMDKGIQESVRNSTMIFEQIIKTSFAYHLSEKFGHLESIYLDDHNFKTGKIDRNGNSQLYYLQNKFNKIINEELEPYKHYREEHGHIPAWILLKGTSLGNVKIFYSLQRKELKTKIIQSVLNLSPLIESQDYPDVIYNYFTSLLNLAHLFRNRASHNGRIYNYKANYKHTPYFKPIHDSMNISKTKFKKEKLGKNDLYTLLYFLRGIDDITPYVKLKVGISYSINNHLSIYPDDKEFILEQIGVPKTEFDKEIKDIF
ncbi:MAG: Abi family protein [Anaerococcus prevotii]|uniref:Abi family protein n=1 Tax=Anaerococcus prevotii TaxID=33034 RepID=UPI0029015DAB|nr:Abi family protein [Anaerococcus prevotii]MDU2557457.1 Abi family protein [Anaerococcus prevotii]